MYYSTAPLYLPLCVSVSSRYTLHQGRVSRSLTTKSYCVLGTATACLRDIGQAPHEKTEESLRGMNKYKQVFRLRVVHLMSVFLFLYVGVEVSIGGWIVTFIINERSGGRNSGYVSSGFWGGLTLGRVALLPLNKKVNVFVHLSHA